jgi:hypothetical protein
VGPVRDEEFRSAIARVAVTVIDARGATSPKTGAPLASGIGPMSALGRHRGAGRLLLGEVPGFPGVVTGQSVTNDGESATDTAIHAVRSMAPGLLAIHGRPGTGKTTTAPRMILCVGTVLRRASCVRRRVRIAMPDSHRFVERESSVEWGGFAVPASRTPRKPDAVLRGSRGGDAHLQHTHWCALDDPGWRSRAGA